MAEKNYDPQCLALAEVFVGDLSELSASDRAKLADKLAASIQSTIELSLEYAMGPCDCCGEPRAKSSHAACIFF